MTVIGVWVGAVAWFHPHLITLLDLGTTVPQKLSLWFFVLFIDIAWAYAAYNVSVILFSMWYHRKGARVRERGGPALFPVAAPAMAITAGAANEAVAEIAVAGSAVTTIGAEVATWLRDDRAVANRGIAALLQPAPLDLPPVALLYTTCNDFVESSVLSCIAQDYPCYRVYILDDSSDPAYRERIDEFAARHAGKVTVVRRANRRGYKAGNLNDALATVAHEPLFALVDADEFLPPDFLKALVPRILAMPDCGFIQANHRSNPNAASPLARDLGPGVDSHWRWYHPLRNDYGFVMLLGHGALIRRQVWSEIGGFPEIVSEDLAFAVHAREAGWRGYFAEDVICYEEFPEDVRAFRVRHMKWTRGTCEFLAKEGGRLLRSRHLSWVEKVDIFLPTLNLPLSFLFFLFVINANLVLTSFFGSFEYMTGVVGGQEWRIPVLRLDPGFTVLNRTDLFIVTLVALTSPVLCFVLDMWRQPHRLWSFLSKSTALYGALGPLSSIGVLLFGITRRAVFHVTADRSSHAATLPECAAVADQSNVIAFSPGVCATAGVQIGVPVPTIPIDTAASVNTRIPVDTITPLCAVDSLSTHSMGISAGASKTDSIGADPAALIGTAAAATATIFSPLGLLRAELRQFALRSHPDHPLVQSLELICGATLIMLACASIQLPFLGLALAYFMLPLLHHLRWDSRLVRLIVHVPFFLIVTGVGLSSLSLLGIQTVFFGYGFHF